MQCLKHPLNHTTARRLLCTLTIPSLNLLPSISPNPSGRRCRGGFGSTTSISALKHLHGSIIASGLGADRFLNNHLMNLYAKFGEMGIAVKVYGSMPRKNIMSSNVLVSGLVRNRDLEGARKLFDKIPEKNVESWNGMIVGLVQEGRFEEGLGFVEMIGEGFSPDGFSLGSVVSGCVGLEGS